ncbi:MAG: response regulator transcription factor [Saprospiraceae bacterium]|jgi:two-component system LytT family response regulator|nr:response regulator transcription factor [Saprospiraceae bacterium]
MKTIIIDDEIQGIAVLTKLLDLHCPMVQVVATCQSADEAKQMIHVHTPDLIFLDISMPGKSGIQMLKDLDEINFFIIFVTAFDQYMLQAIRLSALDYLLKPVHEDDLIEAIKKAEKQLRERSDKNNIASLLSNIDQSTKDLKISIPTFDGFLILKLSDILYCEADNNYTKIHLIDLSRHLVTKPLSYFDNLLTPCQFTRIHKSWLVNLDHIIAYSKTDGGTITITNGHKLEISKRKKDSLLLEIKKHLINR